MILIKKINRKKLLLAFLCLVGIAQVNLHAQTYGNEWIDYTQQYYKIPIANEGVYKVTYSDMLNAGIPVGSITPDQFQIFAREQEIPLKITGSSDNSFDSGDEVRFYGRGNDAWLDSLLYPNPSDVGNPRYSLYNDTITYFLTWNTAGNSLRYQEENDVVFSAYTPQNYFWKTHIDQHNSTYLKGDKLAGLSYSRFVNGEGWFSNTANGGGGSGYTFNINIPSPQVYASGPSAQLQAYSASASNASHTGPANHHFQLVSDNGIILADSIFLGYQLTHLSLNIPISELSGTTNFKHKIIDDMGAASDHQAIGLHELTYPHQPHLENKNFFKFSAPTTFAQNKTRYDISGYSPGNWHLWSIDNQPQSIQIPDNGSNLQCLIPDGSGLDMRKMIAFKENSISNISSLNPVNGSGNFTDFASTLSNNPYFIITHQQVMSGAQSYANYRSGAQGGNYNVATIDVEELYMQFGGGIRKHILGVRRFLDASINKWNLSPEFVFIIGKSVREADESSATGPGSRKSVSSYQKNLVPSFGYPSSDNLIVAGLDGNGIKPGIPLGRLAAQSNNDVITYLNKMQTFEGNQDPNSIYTFQEKEWQKQVLHFGGGSQQNEQIQFKGYLNNYKDKITDTLFGGHVESYFKTTSQPINPVTGGQVNERIEDGVSLMTFFGHATADGFDQNVDDPASWNNQGKYPFVLGNACYTGDIHQPSSASTSEEWVLIDQLGCVGFLSTVKLGYAFSLNQFSDSLYREISSNSYGKPIGVCIQKTINKVQSLGSNQAYTSAFLGMTLHGDPALRLNHHDKPEFVIDESRVFVTPEEIDLNVDSLNLNIVVTNLGKATDDLVQVQVTRKFPNNNGDSTYIQYLDGSYYRDTIVFKMPVYANIGVGINTFDIKVDRPSNTPEQYDETFNNELSYQHIIDIDGIVPAWPYEYAVVPYDTITVKASTINPLEKQKTYRFELDTTDLFNSPFKKIKVVNHAGGTVEVPWDEWKSASTGQNNPLNALDDSTVLFWRVAKDSTQPTWFESSFQYIPNRWGWGQDHFFQRKNNNFNGQIYSRANRDTEFGDNYKKITCEVFGDGQNLYEWNGTLYRINGEIAEYGLCGLSPSIHVAVIDPLSLEPWGSYFNGVNPNHQFNNENNGSNCRSRVEKYFIFRQNSTSQLQALNNMLQNEIPNGHYVLIYSTLYGEFSNWSTYYPALFSTINSLGSDSIQAGDPDRPFILFTQKGSPNTAREVVGQNIDDYISLSDTIFGANYIGGETSTTIGPAFSWDKLYWQSYTSDPTPDDSVRIKLIGIQTDDAEDLVLDTVLTFNDSIGNLNSWAPPNTYPKLKLKTYQYDSVNFTPRQLGSWHVLYDPVPEAAYKDAQTVYKTFGDTLSEGEDASFAIDIQNISQFPMDSMKVDYWIEDADRIRHNLPYPRQDSLRVLEKLRDTISFNSRFYPGLNSLWVEVNPYVTPQKKDQPEQYHFNNIAQIPFYVDADNENPILDVTFDGEHILNGDIVSPSPEILISLKDENPYLIMNEVKDTVHFDLQLMKPDGSIKNLYFSGGGDYNISFEPATGNNKKFKIYYRPKKLSDGKYKLRVQGEDKSGNKSGDFYYEIEFEVINKSTITRLMNYPNPFSTSTRFVFTLTGNEKPDYMKIQIMTIAGNVVREITLGELGPIKIGRNITSYAWDGRDEYGDFLANGIYLYRVIAKIDGESIELRKTGADEYFKKNFGKMVLFR